MAPIPLFQTPQKIGLLRKWINLVNVEYTRLLAWSAAILTFCEVVRKLDNLTFCKVFT